MLTAFSRKRSVQLGFNLDHVLSFGLSFPSARYPHQAEQWRFMQAARHRLEVLPGVHNVAFASFLPLEGGAKTGYTLPGKPRAKQMDVYYYPISTGYLRTMQIALLRGRGFTAADLAKAPPVTIINQALA